MQFALTSTRVFGFRMFVESIEKSPRGKLLDWLFYECEYEFWVGGFLHIVISNEKGYEKLCKRTDEYD